jgi:hypothetical protein
VEFGTDITSGRKRTNPQDSQDDPGAGIGEASERDAEEVTTRQTLDIVQGSTPSEGQKVTE